MNIFQRVEPLNGRFNRLSVAEVTDPNTGHQPLIAQLPIQAAVRTNQSIIGVATIAAHRTSNVQS